MPGHRSRPCPQARKGWPAGLLKQTLLATSVALIACGNPVAAGEETDRSIVDQLRKGGYVVYVRHFETDQSRDDTDPLHLENTSAQRPLTDAGRAQARAVGAAFRALSIPIGRVICSQFERTRESAKLMAVGEPAATADVSAGQSASSGEEKKRRIEALRKLLSTPPAAGRNTLIVSHNSNLEEAAGVEYGDVAEGEEIGVTSVLPTP